MIMEKVEPAHVETEGITEIFGIKVRFYILKDGRRVINAADAKNVFASLGFTINE